MFGFTRNEQKVLLFLSVCFLTGGAIKIYQNHYQTLPVTPGDPIFQKDKNPECLGETASYKDQADTGSFLTVSLNVATQADLERIPGIGPVMAKRIITYRREQGRFGSINELLRVKGIGPKKLLKIRPYIKMQ
jgi:comEA protein